MCLSESNHFGRELLELGARFVSVGMIVVAVPSVQVDFQACQCQEFAFVLSGCVQAQNI